MYVNHSFIFLITSDSIKDSDYNNLIIFLGMVNELNSSKSENDLNLNNDKGNNDKRNTRLYYKLMKKQYNKNPEYLPRKKHK